MKRWYNVSYMLFSTSDCFVEWHLETVFGMLDFRAECSIGMSAWKKNISKMFYEVNIADLLDYQAEMLQPYHKNVR